MVVHSYNPSTEEEEVGGSLLGEFSPFQPRTFGMTSPMDVVFSGYELDTTEEKGACSLSLSDDWRRSKPCGWPSSPLGKMTGRTMAAGSAEVSALFSLR